MRIIYSFFHAVQGVIARKKLHAVVFATFSLGLFTNPAAAYRLELEISGANGGKIGNIENSYVCEKHCQLQTFSKNLLSLVALAEDGYRFAGWEGACENRMGPLCTLKPDDNVKVGARFVKNHAVQPSAQALLLLHNANEKNSVWNEFIQQRFNNRCPVIYGGVILDQDSFDARSRTACYRIAFGYYDLLKVGMRLEDGLDIIENTFSKSPLGYEIRAGVLGLLSRHPGIHVTLIGHGEAADAALAYLKKTSSERKNVDALIALNSAAPRVEADRRTAEAIQLRDFAGVRYLKIAANPAQSRKINTALATLANAKWSAR